jgi:hypothetical protein
MGIKPSPDFAQEVMEEIFRNMNHVQVYINNIGIFAQSWEHHQTIISQVLKQLEDNSFTVNQLHLNVSGPSKKPIGLVTG